MKKIFVSMIMGFTLLFALVSTLTGLFIMADTLLNHNGNGFKGFELFSIGAILFIVILSGYMISKILNYTEVIVDSLTVLVEHTIDGVKKPNPLNPFEMLFNNISMPPGAGTITMSKMDENGNITPFMEKEFNTQEEFIKHRDEILSKALGGNDKKKVEDMTLEELQSEEQKAVATQNFELAACIRDAINEKTKKKG